MQISKEIFKAAIALAYMKGQTNAKFIPDFLVTRSYADKLLDELMIAAGKNEKLIASGEATKECYDCIYKQNVPGNAHIMCNNPDPDMTGNPHGIKNGWFIYPELFDLNHKYQILC